MTTEARCDRRQHLWRTWPRRGRIDEIAGELLTLLSEGTAHVDRVMVRKAATGVDAVAPTRYAAVIAALRAGAAARGAADMAKARGRAMIEALIDREQREFGKDGVDG